jgi:LacI family transcriptional regulator
MVAHNIINIISTILISGVSMGKITIKDVAEHAGVSTATVSHVINKTRFVTDETKEKVLISVDELGYRPNLMARSFKQGRRNLIGFVVPDLNNIFYSDIIEEVERTILPYDYRLVTSHTKETKKRESDFIDSLTSGIVDGIIITSTMSSYEELEKHIPKDFPTVFIDRLLDNCPHDTILVDTFKSVRVGVQSLIEYGHRKIGFITGIPHISTSIERLNAYIKTLETNNIPIDKKLICYGDSMSQSAMPHVKSLLQLGCTALVIGNGIMTVDVIYFLQENNIPIGEKNGVDIVGFNDYGGINHLLHYIYSIDQPTKAVGKAAGEQIIERINNPKIPTRQIIFESTLCKKHQFKAKLSVKNLEWKSIL